MRLRQNGWHFADIFKSVFLKIVFSFKFQRNLFPKAELTISQHWFQLIFWCWTGVKPLSEAMLMFLLLWWKKQYFSIVPIRSAYTQTLWRALLFRAIFGITGALIMCFDIWRFKQAKNSRTGFGDHHCDFEQHVPCLSVHVCMNFVKFVLEAPGASILWGRYYSMSMCRLTWGGGGGGGGGGGVPLLGRALLMGT